VFKFSDLLTVTFIIEAVVIADVSARWFIASAYSTR